METAVPAAKISVTRKVLGERRLKKVPEKSELFFFEFRDDS